MEDPPPSAASSEPAPVATASAPSEASHSNPSSSPNPAQPPPSTASSPSIAAPSTSQNPPQPQSQSIPPSQSHQPIQQHLRPPVLRNRPQSSFPHFDHQLPSPATPSISSSTSSAGPAVSASPSAPTSSSQRAGLAIGVPAHSPHIRAQESSAASYPTFGASSSFTQPFSALPRMPEQPPTANAQVRQPIQGIQNIGMIGSLSTSSQIRSLGASGPPQQRFIQPTSRGPAFSVNQKFQSSNLMRGPSVISSSSMPSLSQQPLSSQGKQMPATLAPSSSFRPQMKQQTIQQRPNLPNSITSQQMVAPQQQQQQQQLQQHKQHQQMPQQMQQPHQQPQQFLQHHASSRQPQEQYSQQNLQLRNQQQLQQAARPLRPASSKANLPTLVQTNPVQSGAISAAIDTDAAESGNQVLSKRSIRELVNQIDPSEKLDSEVEDILVDIGEDFIESITTFACSLAKHRKSSTLEAKDILLHVERNWNITLPGFGGDEVKCYKKQITNDIHKERLAVVCILSMHIFLLNLIFS
ncbi:transcription initiation factor TFIID subunit 12-like isoform X1 [Zingiber officinale]|uniref:transcription initiation factor TFIID subunit 12-like isoform X1 n=1 Tax=Zingiber officinale TaxID=94328 RepID=UPI001C4B9FE4|nr:transcription initiation factor TFIID subunit 12-like isoform X1 [Zingiber officinale]